MAEKTLKGSRGMREQEIKPVRDNFLICRSVSFYHALVTLDSRFVRTSQLDNEGFNQRCCPHWLLEQPQAVLRAFKNAVRRSYDRHNKPRAPCRDVVIQPCSLSAIWRSVRSTILTKLRFESRASTSGPGRPLDWRTPQTTTESAKKAARFHPRCIRWLYHYMLRCPRSSVPQT